MEKVVLVNIKSKRIVYPLGLLYVGTALKKAGFDVKIYNISPEEIDAKIGEIEGLVPLFIGFSVFTGIHTVVAAEMAHKLKKNSPSFTIVWGGVHPSLLPEQCLREDFVDIAVIGEGEETVVELAQSLRDKLDLSAVKGIAFKSAGKILVNDPRPQIKNLDNSNLDWSLININECIEELPDGTKYVAYTTSRGCPFNCGFCYNLAFNKRKWRPQSFGHVTKEIMRLKEISGINGILFYDDNFMVDIPRALKILRFLKDNGIKCVRLEMRLDSLNKDILNAINELDVRAVFLGWESGSNRILKLINKGITREEIMEKMRLFTCFPHIGVSAAGIIGFPTETWDETCQTIDLGLKIAEMIPFNMVTLQTFLPYPGTDLYPLAIKGGLKPPQRAKDWAGYNTFYGDTKLEWLPWATKATSRIFYRIDKYGKLLNHAPSTSFLRSLGKKICYLLARARLKHKFFYFPVEIFILHRFNRYCYPGKRYSRSGIK